MQPATPKLNTVNLELKGVKFIVIAHKDKDASMENVLSIQVENPLIAVIKQDAPQNKIAKKKMALLENVQAKPVKQIKNVDNPLVIWL